MRKLFFSLFMSAIGIIGLCDMPTALAKAGIKQPLDRIIAIVEQETITQSKLDQAIAVITQQLAASAQALPDETELRKQVLNRLIDKALQLNLAKVMGLAINDMALDQAVGDIAAENHMSLDELKQQLSAQHIDYQQFRQDTRDNLLLQAIQHREVFSKIKVDTQELRKAVEEVRKQQTQQSEYRLQHVFVAVDETADAGKKQAALQLTNSLSQRLSREQALSEDQLLEGFTVKFENHDWQKVNEIPALFVEKLQKMQRNEISTPIVAPNGYHLVKLLEMRQPAHVVKEYHARQIVRKISANAPAESVLEDIRQLRARVMHGESFARLAETYSQEPDSASKGGDMGWIEPDALVAPLAQALQSLPVQAISDPIRSHLGWCVLQKLGEREVHNQQQWEEKQARNIVLERNFNKSLVSWLQTLRNHAYIKIDPAYQ